MVPVFILTFINLKDCLEEYLDLEMSILQSWFEEI